MITQQVLLQQQKIGQQIHPAQTVQHKYVPQQVFTQAAVPEQELKQSYPQSYLPQQFLLQQQPQQHQQQKQRQQPQVYQEQTYLQQPQFQNYRTAQLPKQQSQQLPNLNYSFYDNSGIQKINDELLSVADQNYKTVDLTSTTPKAEKESVQLLYVPLEHLQQSQQQPTTSPLQSQKRHRQKQVAEPQRKGNLLENIEKDFIQQALQAHKLQEQLEHQNYYTPSYIIPPPTTTTLRPISRKRKPHQPPLAVYMSDDSGNPKVTDVLNALKDAKTIEVQDTIGSESPHVFVGPANLDPPEGFAKFELPYLSNIESNRIERKVDQLPFFVAPLNYKAPPGYSKIPFPSPHVGSVVINKNELEPNPTLEAVPSVEDFLSPYHSIQPAPADVTPKIETASVRSIVREEEPVYHIRRPSRTRGRQQDKSRPHTNIVAEQAIQSRPSSNFLNSFEAFHSKNNANTFSTVNSTPSPNRASTNQPRVEINNPSINLNNQLREQASFDQRGIQQYQQKYRQRPNVETPTSSLEDKQNSQKDNYYTDISSVTPSTVTENSYKEQPSSFKQTSEFEIIPSISSTISPFHDKNAVENFFRQFSDFSSSTTPAASYLTNTKVNEQNYKRPGKEDTENVYSIIPTVATKQSTAQNDRRYLPFDSQASVPPQIDYGDIIQLPLGINQAGEDIRPSTLGIDASLQKEISSQGSVDEGDYKILNEYPVTSSGYVQKEKGVSHNEQPGRPQTSEIVFEQVPVRQSTRQKSRGRIHQDTAIRTTQGSRERNTPQIQEQTRVLNENYESLSGASGRELQQSLPLNNIHHTQPDVNIYQHEQGIVDSPISNPILPGLINSLEDASIRQLLAPILLAPPEQINKHATVISQPTETPNSNDHVHFGHAVIPGNINYNQEQITTTTSSPLPISAEPTAHVETTTQKRPRGRGRGNSRYNDRTTTNSPRRNPLKARTQHPSRNRFRTTSTTTTTTEVYNPIRQNVYSSTTEKSRRLPTRQRYKSRSKPLHTEYFSSTPKVNRIPETTTPQVVVAKQEEESNVEIHQQYYNEQPLKKPQLITRSKILTPEEEYLVNKYNLQVVTTAEEPVTEIINDQYHIQTTKENLPEQYLDSSKTVNVQQQFYPSSTIVPTTTEADITTRRAPFKHIHSSNYNTERNTVKTATNRAPVKIRTRIRSRKTTQRPTTTARTVSPSSLEEQEQEFYGFFKQPAFTKPATETTLKTPLEDDSIYNPIVIASSPQTNYYEDDFETNEDGVQIFSNNQQSPSTPVHFIGELLPKQITTEKFYEATYEPLPSADRYISTSTTTEEPKRVSRLPLRRNNKQGVSRDNDIQVEEPTRRTPTRTRSRGRNHYKSPAGVTTEQSSDNQNYPQSYLDAKNQPVSKESHSPQTDRPAFKITIDPGDADEESEDDQEPYSSILRPKVLPPASNHWVEEDKSERKYKETVTTTAINSNDYETTTTEPEDLLTTTMPEDGITTSETVKKRGFWKLVKLRKVIDEFETAESQNVGVVSVNSFANEFDKDSKLDGEKKPYVDSNAENEEDDFLDSLYTMFGLTTIKSENETTTPLPETSTAATETTSLKQTSSSEIPTTATPIMPEELETTTEEDSAYVDSVFENEPSLNEEENADLDMEMVETSTSTSTEISQKTEICFRGVCINSNEMK